MPFSTQEVRVFTPCRAPVDIGRPGPDVPIGGLVAAVHAMRALGQLPVTWHAEADASPALVGSLLGWLLSEGQPAPRLFAESTTARRSSDQAALDDAAKERERRARDGDEVEREKRVTIAPFIVDGTPTAAPLELEPARLAVVGLRLAQVLQRAPELWRARRGGKQAELEERLARLRDSFAAQRKACFELQEKASIVRADFAAQWRIDLPADPRKFFPTATLAERTWSHWNDVVDAHDRAVKAQEAVASLDDEVAAATKARESARSGVDDPVAPPAEFLRAELALEAWSSVKPVDHPRSAFGRDVWLSASSVAPEVARHTDELLAAPLAYRRGDALGTIGVGELLARASAVQVGRGRGPLGEAEVWLVGVEAEVEGAPLCAVFAPA